MFEGSNPWFLLIVDDCASVVTLLAKIAAMIPYLDVATAYSAEAALKIAGNRPPDLVISDLNMPGHDGNWLLTELKRIGISCPFIVFTGCHDTARAVETYRAGATRYIMKPASVSELYQAMLDALPAPVKFEINAEPGSLVYVAGDFNDWEVHQYQLIENPEPGHFICSIPLSRGRHEYKFIINDQWLCDPKRSDKVITDHGFENSVINVEIRAESPLSKGLALI